MIKWFDKLTFSDFGNFASIIGLLFSVVGLVITCKTYKKLNNIEDRFVLNVRIKEYTAELEKFSSDMTRLLGKFDSNIDNINEKLALVNVSLRNIQKSADTDLLEDIKSARQKIKDFREKNRINLRCFFQDEKKVPKEQLAREIITAINVVVQELKNQDKHRTITR